VVLVKPKRVSQVVAHNFVLHYSLQIREILEIIKNQPNYPFFKHSHYLKHKERARDIVNLKIQKWNKFYNFSFNRIHIKRLRSRWGSCSSKGNLNFNYKIIFLPEELVDYIIVHELCHLEQMNHSKKFWDLVAKTIPDFLERSRELKKVRNL